ncbi:R3H domain-containing protein 1 isoform X1 [Cucumis melo var. makuwa]|uniref:R3H domain-containing protein 1 isoform X1 n=1 Tax=Cucumis melo var. makuwa TaxID=1194695 RepID=A0A5A7U0E9_CUCMM|nr:R3H domain-containing protein 1 isoform X1 [Cucumis melo var. makuwa]
MRSTAAAPNQEIPKIKPTYPIPNEMLYIGLPTFSPMGPTVEELAFLVKDNLPSKHLILSMEETFINFLHDETSSSDGILELKPMDSYNRLLLHRLADIFGLGHVSAGEGDNRHLVLERYPESSIPSILVSDILWEYDEPQMSTIPHQLLRRKENSSASSAKSSPQRSLEERETAYLAVRERIFMTHIGEDNEPLKPKPRCDPAVARRMIAHALGQRVNSFPEDTNCHRKVQGVANNAYIQARDSKLPNSTVEAINKTISQSDQCMNLKNESDKNCNPNVSLARGSTAAKMKLDKSSPKASHDVDNEHLKREHLGAAKRMFSQALGKHCRKNESLQTRCGEAD